MENQNFSATLLVDQTPEQVFAAINNVRGWWTGNPGIEGSTDKLNDEFTYDYEPYHHTKQRITELIPGKKIVWLVIESSINFVEDKNEWTGTTITFELTKKGGKTEVRFTHIGLVPDSECYADCSKAWSSYISNSLRDFIAGEKEAA